MDGVIARRLAALYEEGRRGVLCIVAEEAGSTPRSAGSSMLVYPDGSIEGTVGGGIMEHRVIERALEMLSNGSAPLLHRESLTADEAAFDGAVCGGTLAVYLEVIGRSRELIIFGAGHVGRALARAGETAGFQVTVWDEREEFANPENIPWGRTVCCPLEKFFEEKGRFHGRTSVVAVTRGHSLDAEVVRALEGLPLAYIGMIGSRKKIAFVRQGLLESGVSEAFLEGIYQPVGLPIGAETPEEIAVSVLAEIIAVDRGADVAALRGEKKG